MKRKNPATHITPSKIRRSGIPLFCSSNSWCVFVTCKNCCHNLCLTKIILRSLENLRFQSPWSYQRDTYVKAFSQPLCSVHAFGTQFAAYLSKFCTAGRPLWLCVVVAVVIVLLWVFLLCIVCVSVCFFKNKSVVWTGKLDGWERKY